MGILYHTSGISSLATPDSRGPDPTDLTNLLFPKNNGFRQKVNNSIVYADDFAPASEQIVFTDQFNSFKASGTALPINNGPTIIKQIDLLQTPCYGLRLDWSFVVADSGVASRPAYIATQDIIQTPGTNVGVIHSAVGSTYAAFKNSISSTTPILALPPTGPGLIGDFQRVVPSLARALGNGYGLGQSSGITITNTSTFFDISTGGLNPPFISNSIPVYEMDKNYTFGFQLYNVPGSSWYINIWFDVLNSWTSTTQANTGAKGLGPYYTSWLTFTTTLFKMTPVTYP